MPLAEARKAGAMMLFGEKYPDVVRMLSMGDFSKELCGGTHLENTAQVGLMKIIGEESVAAGVRRITALTGGAALDHVRRTDTALARAAAVLRVPPEEVPDRVEAIGKELRQLKKQGAAAGKAGGPSVEQLLHDAADFGGTKVVIAEVPGGGPQDMRQLIDQLRRKTAPLAVLLGSRSEEEQKVTLIAGLTRDLTAKGFDATAWVRAAAEVVGGSGGGRPDMAQGRRQIAAETPRSLRRRPAR